MSEPTVHVAYRFTFKDGREEFVDLVHGRDTAQTTHPSEWFFQLQHEDGVIEDITIYPAHLACWRKAVRVIQPEDKTPEPPL